MREDDQSEPPFGHDNYILYAMQLRRVYLPFFRTFLPEAISKHVDLDRLALVPQTLTSSDLQRRYMDHAYAAPLKTDPETWMKFHIIFEHKSNKEGLNPLKMMEYKLELLKRFYKGEENAELPLVHPVIFYHGRHPYRGAARLRDMAKAPKVLRDEVVDQMTVVDRMRHYRRWIRIWRL